MKKILLGLTSFFLFISILVNLVKAEGIHSREFEKNGRRARKRYKKI